MAGHEKGARRRLFTGVWHECLIGGRSVQPRGVAIRGHTCRAIIIFLISAMALAGLRPFGQVLAQFMIVWQR